MNQLARNLDRAEDRVLELMRQNDQLHDEATAAERLRIRVAVLEKRQDQLVGEVDGASEMAKLYKDKLTTLESAVRTVRDKSTFLDIFGVPDIYLDDLYLLVPTAAEDGGS